MKRAKNLFDRIASFENLWLASRRARRGKRFRDDVAAFEFNLEGELALLSEELRDGSWQPGPYRRFIVREPKQRLNEPTNVNDNIGFRVVVSARNARCCQDPGVRAPSERAARESRSGPVVEAPASARTGRMPRRDE